MTKKGLTGKHPPCGLVQMPLPNQNQFLKISPGEFSETAAMWRGWYFYGYPLHPLDSHCRLRLHSSPNLFVNAQRIVLDNIVDGTLNLLLILCTRELIGRSSYTCQIGAGMIAFSLIKLIPGIKLCKRIIRIIDRCQCVHSLSLPFIH